MPIVLGPTGANDEEVISWFDAAGTQHILSFPSTIFLLPGRRGWWTIPSRIRTQDLALQPGAAFRSVKDETRPVDLPLYVNIMESAAARDAVRLLSHWFDPTAGEGYLHVDYGDSARLLRARAVGVMFAEDATIRSTPWVAVVNLLALHPYWQDVDPMSTVFTPGLGAGTFFPLPPLRLSASSLFGQATVTNDGDVEAWPIWTIQAPAQDITLTNVTTGRQFALRNEYLLRSGSTLTIDTRPLIRSVTDESGNSAFGYQQPASEMWPLVPGPNDVRVQMGSTDPDTTLVTLEFTQEYRTP